MKKILISSVDEQLVTRWLAQTEQQELFEFLPADAFFASNDESTRIWVYLPPWQIGSSEDLDRHLERWSRCHKEALRCRGQQGRIQFVHAARTCPDDLFGLLGVVRRGVSGGAGPEPEESAEESVIAHLLQTLQPQVWDLFEALESAAFMVDGQKPLFRQDLPDPGINALQRILSNSAQAALGLQAARERDDALLRLSEAQRLSAELQSRVAELTRDAAGQAVSEARPDPAVARLEQEKAELNSELQERYRELASLARLLEASEHSRAALEEQHEAAQAELARFKNGGLRAILAPMRKLYRKCVKQSPNRKLDAKIRLLRESALFDPEWYLSTYPDVASSGVEPALHYVKFGGLEGRNPSPAFDSRDYLERYPDVARAGLNPLIHYLQFGNAEKREINPVRETA